jgi:hypothetical protein
MDHPFRDHFSGTGEYIANQLDIIPAPHQSYSEEELIKWLAVQILMLLNQNRDYFFGVCYRLDLDEQKVKSILSGTHLEDPGVLLAKEIILKVKQRNQWKAYYRNRG